MTLHIIPTLDLRPHEESEACWCQPIVETVDPRTGEPYPNDEKIVIHRALDCREGVEQAEEILNPTEGEDSGEDNRPK